MIDRKRFSIFFCCLCIVAPLSAQESSPVITTKNITNLVSVEHIDFANPSLSTIESGWFVLDSTSDLLAVKNRDNELVILTDKGDIVDRYTISGSDNLPTTILDAAFNADPTILISAHLEGGIYYVAYHYPLSNFTEYYRFVTSDVPLRVWADTHVWLEMSPSDPTESRYILQLNPIIMNRLRQNEVLTDSEMSRLASAPENDPDSFLRVGRIEPPLAVTITRNGLVKRWNLETGDVTAKAQVSDLPGAGQISADGHYFAWRDGESKSLHLLDFETGHDRVVAPLDGTYLPFMALTPAADVIIAVNAGLLPVVTAWNASSGERYDLGEYRSCGRQPDMVHLSQDGTTLVIGCDTGLDIWRIS